MRNPVATPASIIFGILILGFLVLVGYSLLAASKTAYVLEQNRALHIWGNAFLLFSESFFAFQCAGALIAYSLFLSVPVFAEKKSLFRYLSSVLISLVFLTALYIAGREGFAPLVQKNLDETRKLGLFSESLFEEAEMKVKAGDPVAALELMRYALQADSRNPEKIEAQSTVMAGLSDEQFEEYLARLGDDNRRDAFRPEPVLVRARAALEKKDLPRAYEYAQSVLAVDPANAEAIRIAGIAGDESYRKAAQDTVARERYLFAGKKEGLGRLEAGKRGSVQSLVDAYYLFLDLRRQFPLDRHVQEYLEETRHWLPTWTFFSTDAETALAFRSLAVNNIVFFNKIEAAQRELVAVERLVAVGGATYLKNIEVAGWGSDQRLLYHYMAPLGKIAIHSEEQPTGGKKPAFFININGIDKRDPGRRSLIRAFTGVPRIDRERGIKLNVAPSDLDSYGLTPADIEGKSLGDLFFLIPPLKDPALFARHARMDELIMREIILRVSRPLLLVILTLICFSVGLTQNARYLSSVPPGIYVWVLVIPFVMLALADVILFLHRMSAVFLFEVLGPVPGTALIGALHVFFLILALLRYSGKISSSLRR